MQSGPAGDICSSDDRVGQPQPVSNWGSLAADVAPPGSGARFSDHSSLWDVQTTSGLKEIDAHIPIKDLMKSNVNLGSLATAKPLLGMGSSSHVGFPDLDVPPDLPFPGDLWGSSCQAVKGDFPPSGNFACENHNLFKSCSPDDAFIWTSSSDKPGPYGSSTWMPAGDRTHRNSGVASGDVFAMKEEPHFCVGPGCCICTPPTLGRDPTGFNSSLFGNTSLYPSEVHNTRMSMKVGGATPADLPRNLYGMMCDTMGVSEDSNSITGYIRPGCVFMTIDTVLGSLSHTGRAMENLPDRVRCMVRSGPWASKSIQVQIGGALLGFEGGELVSHMPIPADIPAIMSLSIAVADDTIQAVVANFSLGTITPLLRMDGHYMPCNVDSVQPLGSGLDLVTISCEDEGLEGMAWLELMDSRHGHHLLSEDIPILLTSNAGVAKELCCLSSMTRRPPKSEVISLLQDIDTVLHGDLEESSLDLCCDLGHVACSQGWAATFLACIDRASSHAPLSRLVDCYGQQWLTAAVKTGVFKLVAQVVYFFASARRIPDVVNELDRGQPSILDCAIAHGEKDIVRLLYGLMSSSRPAPPRERGGTMSHCSRVEHTVDSELQACQDEWNAATSSDVSEATPGGQLNRLCFAALALRLLFYIFHLHMCQSVPFFHWRLMVSMGSSMLSLKLYHSCTKNRELHHSGLAAMQLLTWCLHFLLMWDASGGFIAQSPPYSWSAALHLSHGGMALVSAAISNVSFFSHRPFDLESVMIPFVCTWLYYLGPTVIHSKGAMAVWKESLAALIPAIAATGGLLLSHRTAGQLNPPLQKKQKHQ